ncbi:acyltransferase family protein [Ruminococcus albus]|uniref:acyltransferase family protein n=1 Tax=Ruminococcus albus TaxID=1264 RepID=UPI00055CD53A|nr:acyltransferase family protein [Ruminococcus albus]MCC3351458.1 acyltransferase family protein [Ruminococcus albus 8]
MEISSKTSKKDFDNRNCQVNVKNRIEYIDVTRTIAIISITCNHAVNRSFNVASDSFSEFNNIPLYLTLFKVVVYMFSRIGVPLFLMISGALLLHRDYTDEGKLNRFLKHNLE